MSVMIIQLRPITHIDFSYVINTVRLWNAVATFTIVSAMDMIWQKRAINENIKFLLSFLLTLCLYNLFWWRLNIYLEGKYMFLQMNLFYNENSIFLTYAVLFLSNSNIIMIEILMDFFNLLTYFIIRNPNLYC